MILNFPTIYKNCPDTHL